MFCYRCSFYFLLTGAHNFVQEYIGAPVNEMSTCKKIFSTCEQKSIFRLCITIRYCITIRAFVNTHLFIHKHVKISVDEWILETTCPQKHVKFLEFYTKDFNK